MGDEKEILEHLVGKADLHKLYNDAEGGDADSQRKVAKRTEVTDRRLSFLLYRRYAERGNAECMTALGELYDPDGSDPSRADLEHFPEKAVEWLTKGLEGGDTKAAYGLGKHCLSGSGTAKDERRAFELFSRGAAAGDRRAALPLAQCYENGTGCERDMRLAEFWYRRCCRGTYRPPDALLGIGRCLAERGREDLAVRWYREAAEGRLPEGCEAMYRVFAEGRGRRANPRKALEWALRGAETGSADCAFRAGVMTASGEGCEPDADKAVELFERAAVGGSPDAMYVMARIFADQEAPDDGAASPEERERTRGDLRRESARWMHMAAKAGSSKAMAELGAMYEHGIDVERDPQKAMEWFTRGAEAGDPVAMVGLAQCYFTGMGSVAADHAAARSWFRKAADLGSPMAMNSLGIMDERGMGGRRDLRSAVSWFRKAAEAGYAPAMNDLGNCYNPMMPLYSAVSESGIVKDGAEAVRWYLAASKKGSPEGTFNLGQCYEHGVGLKKDLALASRAYRAAAEMGFSDRTAEITLKHKEAERRRLGPVRLEAREALDRDDPFVEELLSGVYDEENAGILRRFVFSRGAEDVGYLSYRTGGECLEIVQMVVIKELRGAGFGHEMFLWLMRNLPRGIDHLSAYVPAENTAAALFFQRHGMHFCEETDPLLMEMDVEAKR